MPGRAESVALGAVLFDMDGTLIDSMPLHHRSWQLWHAELGLAFDEAGFFEATAGRTNLEILIDLFPGKPRAELDALAWRKEELYREIAATELQLIAGADVVCAAARARGLKLAVCTAAPRGAPTWRSSPTSSPPEHAPSWTRWPGARKSSTAR